MNIKIAQTTQNSWNLIVRKSSLVKKWQTSANIRKPFQTLIWRPGDTVQNLESPGLSGRVASTTCQLLSSMVFFRLSFDVRWIRSGLDWIRKTWTISPPKQKYTSITLFDWPLVEKVKIILLFTPSLISWMTNASIAFLSRPKPPFPSLSNACQAG